MAKIDSVFDFTDKGLVELKSWLEPWFLTRRGGGAVGWEDVGISCGSTYAEIILVEPSLIAYWPMDDASGNARDASGNGHDLAPQATPTYSQPGPFPSHPALTSIQFDGGAGSSGSYDRFNRTDGALDGYVTGHTGLTIEAWAYPTARPSVVGNAIVQCYGGIVSSVPFQLQHRVAGNVFWQYATTNQIDSVVTLTLNAWTHVAATLDSVAGSALYFNGTLVASGAAAALIDNSSNLFQVGQLDTSPGFNEGWFGRICQVALYSAALSASTIATHAAFS